eukprot:CAMPEP_0204282888 /NCGR_PEP_ID=MMETSP0468-20130131/44727_1 /ASSEMBLY_ACC=CAM_ASM_000383 /TAXON_ID=2969 /ORGANISM="Oxyrrhis marina" /LENGTH=47 /DNA_ID= /DNA_START= /DNA_END= /DNA_ORIENTATION=
MHKAATSSGISTKFTLLCHCANPTSNVSSSTGWVRSTPHPEQRNPGT